MMRGRSAARGRWPALLGALALILQFALPALHAQHAPRDAAADAGHHEIVAHDALACAVCAAIAHGRAGDLAVAAAPIAPAVALDAVTVPSLRPPAAPAPSGAAPRAPPTLA